MAVTAWRSKAVVLQLGQDVVESSEDVARQLKILCAAIESAHDARSAVVDLNSSVERMLVATERWRENVYTKKQ